eukprot:806892-Rhodomonas_salina.1
MRGIGLRTRYAKSGTDVAYAAVPGGVNEFKNCLAETRGVQYVALTKSEIDPATLLVNGRSRRPCYAMSGTDVRLGCYALATRCAVLKCGMTVSGTEVRYGGTRQDEHATALALGAGHCP